jgi:hypothetical protein
MKKTILIAIAAFFTVNVWGQTSTNTFPDAGNVGIGTQLPSNTLTIKADSENSAPFRINSFGSDARGFQVGFTGETAEYISFEKIYSGTSEQFMSVYRVNGNVGIGTTSPDYKLDVDGTVQADGFKAKGGGLGIIRPNTTGGWARGIGFYDIDGTTRYANIGMLGNGAISTRIYLAYGDDPWNSQKGMHILPDGNIGVGTTSPNERLEVKDGAMLFSNLGAEDNVSILKFVEATNYEEFELQGMFAGTSSDNNSLKYRSYWTDNILIIRGDGNIGIGTTNPLSKVHIADANLPTLRLSGTNLNQSNSGTIEFAEDDVANNEARFAILYDGSTNKLHIKSGSVSPSIERLTILRDNGNVGIGTTTPPYKLSVEGTIGAREVIVTSDNWADFVFEENYNLISIKKLESFIEKNKHLPDVPSESEVKENGVSLGEMDKILLQKIEELTLYVIELKKENDELNDKVDALIKQ